MASKLSQSEGFDLLTEYIGDLLHEALDAAEAGEDTDFVTFLARRAEGYADMVSAMIEFQTLRVLSERVVLHKITQHIKKG